jgi:two-component system chemotaxis sensor kinase CheA
MDDIFNNEEMQEILHDFIIETSELLEGIDQQLIDLEKDPENRDILNSVFRSVHTIKGASGFLGFQQIVEVAHKAEEVLNKLRQGELKITPTRMDALLASADMLTTLMRHVKERDGVKEDTSKIIDILKRAEEKGEAESAAPAPPVPPVPPPAQATPVAPPQPAPPVQPVSAASPQPVEPKVVEPQPEPVREPVHAPAQAPAPAETTTRQKPQAEAKQAVKDDSETIRVDTERLDSVMNMVGELVLGRNRLMRLSARLLERYESDDIVAQLQLNSAHLNLITTDLQLAVMKTRMQPIAKVFGRFPRMVRDLAREKKKEVELELVGQETELDKTVIEEIGDPLVHLVRNAVDHGIEPPNDRVKAGKPRTGTLTLSAYHKGSHIYVSIKDDGGGINVEKLKAKALSKGLITEDEAERMSDKELMNLIFMPGFSTAEVVTNTSGRGVGMDVVKTNITKLNGSVDIESTLGAGSNMILRLPLTLAIIHALMLSIGNDAYAVPLSSVVEIVKIDQSMINTVENKETLYFRDRVYPLLRLRDVVGAGGERENDAYAVLMSHGDKIFGLLVEALIGQEEVVIKSMGNYLSGIKGVSGATITGDGRVVLIIDVIGLYTKAGGNSNA